MMKKALKISYRALKFIFIFGLLFSLIFFLSATFVINKYFSKSEINYIFTGELQDIFNRPVRISSVELKPSGYIKIRDLKVYSKDSRDFLISSPYLIITLNPMKLFKGAIEIKTLNLISVNVNLIREKNGEWRFADLINKYKERKKSGKLTLSSFKVEDGKITFRDDFKKVSHSFKDINLELQDILSEKDVNFSLSTFFSSDFLKTRQPGRLYAEGRFNLSDSDPDKDYIKDLQLDISLDDIKIKAAGEIDGLLNPSCELNLSVPPVNLKKILKIKDEIIIPESSILVKAKKTQDGMISLKAFMPSLKASLYSKIKPWPDGFRHETRAEFRSVNAKKINFFLANHIKNPQGEMNIEINSSGKLFEKPAKMGIKGESASLDFSDLYGMINIKKASGKLVINDFFKALNITEGEAFAGQNSAKNLNFKWEEQGGEEFVNTSFKLNNKSVKARLQITRKNSKKSLDALIKEEKTSIPVITGLIELFKKRLAEAKGIKSSGKYDFRAMPITLLYFSKGITNEYGTAKKIYFYGKTTSFKPSLMEMNGKFSIKIKDGSFYDVAKNAQNNKFYYLISLPITTLYKLNRFGALKVNSELKNVEFKEIGADYTLNNGKIVINNFYINGKDFSVYTEGSVDLKEENMDIKVYSVNSKYYAMGSLPESLTDAKGRPAMAFRLKGKFKSNDVKILDPNYNVKTIQEAIQRGVAINEKRADAF